MQFQTIILVLVIGLTAAILTVGYNTRYVGKFVRALFAIDALAPEDAVSVEEMGIKIGPLLRFALRPGSALSDTVGVTSEGKYYILPERAAMARRKYRDEHVTVFFVLFLLLIICIFAVAALYIFPEIKDFVQTRWDELFN